MSPGDDGAGWRPEGRRQMLLVLDKDKILRSRRLNAGHATHFYAAIA